MRRIASNGNEIARIHFWIARHDAPYSSAFFKNTTELQHTTHPISRGHAARIPCYNQP